MTRANDIEETAAYWVARQDGDDWSEQDAVALQSWLDTHLGHKAAFWRLRHGWATADRVRALGFQRVEPRPRPRRARSWPAWASDRRIIASATATAASLLLVASIGIFASRPDDTGGAASAHVLVQTQVGAQRTIALQDGSQIKLNTATVLRAATGTTGREVWLDKGEAYFDIAHRPEHPFVVHAGVHTVTVLGTRFTVRREGQRVTVAVLSGRVRIDDETPGLSTRATVIGQGDIAYAQSHGALVALAAPERVEAMTGWREGILVFENQRLGDAVADFNRYTNRPIRISDPAVANIRIGGTFEISNSARFLDLLHSAYGLEIRPDGDSIIIEP